MPRIAARRTAAKPTTNASRRISGSVGSDRFTSVSIRVVDDGGAVALGLPTTIEAVAAAPGMPLVDVSAPLFAVSTTAWPGPVTITENEHTQLTGSLSPVRLIVCPPLVVTVPVTVLPPTSTGQTSVELSATVSPAGSVSVNPSPIRSSLFVSGL
jgi:hypothetical protein